MELLLQKSRKNAGSQGDPNLLAHVVSADSSRQLVLRGRVIKSDELSREDYASEDTERERDEGLPDTWDGISVSYGPLELVLGA